MTRTMLFFGSFNPIHAGHVAVAEYVVRQGLCDEVVLVVSPHNPLKRAWQLVPELDRFTMAELACAGSAFPEQIKPSAVECLLPKPSYTAHTLRYLVECFGAQRQFSLLVGTDLVAELDRWRDWEFILNHFPIYAYPRPGIEAGPLVGRVTLLSQAPVHAFSSTEIRQAVEQGASIEGMVPEPVARYIREHGLWTTPERIATLTEAVGREAADAGLRMERGRWYYRAGEWGAALNDFMEADRLDPSAEAKEYIRMVREILDFRCTDIYNP